MKHPLNSLYLYLTDECNLKCIHCWQSAPLLGKGAPSNLSFAQCKNFLDTARSMGLKSVTFSGGEPLLNRDFKLFTEYFFENAIWMNIETNGIFISSPEIRKAIIDYKIYCAVSLDGINPETHNKQRGNTNAHQMTVQGIDYLEQEKLNFQLIMTISRVNYHELKPLLEWVSGRYKYCTKFKINIVSVMGRAEEMHKNGMLFAVEELPVICDEIAVLFHKYPFLTLHVDPSFVSFKNFKLKYTCGGYCGYNSSISILANGNISICSLGKQMDKYTFGHVSNIDLQDVWENHPTLKEIHEAQYHQLKGVCANCIFKRQCYGGCRAEALCASGDFFAPHPRCQALYDAGKFSEARLINGLASQPNDAEEMK